MAAIKKHPLLGDHNNSDFFPIVLELGSLRSQCTLQEQRGAPSSLLTLTKALIPTWGPTHLTSTTDNHLLTPCLLLPSLCDRQGFTCELEKDPRTQSIIAVVCLYMGGEPRGGHFEGKTHRTAPTLESLPAWVLLFFKGRRPLSRNGWKQVNNWNIKLFAFNLKHIFKRAFFPDQLSEVTIVTVYYYW